jgi:hypothetical protein
MSTVVGAAWGPRGRRGSSDSSNYGLLHTGGLYGNTDMNMRHSRKVSYLAQAHWLEVGHISKPSGNRHRLLLAESSPSPYRKTDMVTKQH